ncbi:hypothetical protein ACI2KS_10755 [Pseudomonas sp. NPDC087358]|uniref:hypothetical protein n=1 Tax=Pseudomonas sp. NPDC087358 TaxID=3364439 RepID=UPI00384DF439
MDTDSTQNLPDVHGYSVTESTGTNPANLERVVPEEINVMLRVWLSYFKRWYVFHYFLGLLAMTLALVLAAEPKAGGIYSSYFSDYRETIGILSAIATGAVTFLRAQEKASSYTNAWRILNCAKIKYLYGGGTRSDLSDAYKQGEDAIQQCQ